MFNFDNDIETVIIDKKLRNELNENELNEFNLRLNSDKDFSEKYKLMKALMLSVKNSVLSDKLDMLQDFEEAIQSEDRNKSKNSNKKSQIIRKLYFTTAIAASLLLIVFAIQTIWFKQSSHKQLAMQYFDHYPAHVLKRSINQDISELKKKAYALYGIREYEKATPLLSELCELDDTSSCLFAGISLLGNGESNKALMFFNKNELSSDSDVINWYKGLCFWSNENETKAKEVWNKINKNSQYIESVNKILNDNNN